MKVETWLQLSRDTRKTGTKVLHAFSSGHIIPNFLLTDLLFGRVPIPEEFVWELMTQLIMALHECHYGVIVDPETKKTTPRPILHRDLKPDNGITIFFLSRIFRHE